MMRRVWLSACVAMIALLGLVLVPDAGATSGASGVSAEPEPSPSATPTLSLTASPATLTWGARTTLTTQLSLGNAGVRLSRMPAGTTEFTPVGDYLTSLLGIVTLKTTPRVTTTYRAEFDGDAEWAAVAAEVTVNVRPKITFAAADTVYRGKRARLAIMVQPAHPGGSVSIEMWRDGAWTEWREVTLNAESRTVRWWRADSVGRQSIRVRMAADTEHAAGTSGVQKVAVRRPNPYRVPLSAKRIIVVDKSRYRLYFFSYGREVKSFRCVLGRPGLPTPLGHFRIYAKGKWPGGPFGARIMSYHSPYAIHGTNQPHLLKRFPRNYSHGCTRLANANAIWLYSHAPVGTPVWNVP